MSATPFDDAGSWYQIEISRKGGVAFGREARAILIKLPETNMEPGLYFLARLMARTAVSTIFEL